MKKSLSILLLIAMYLFMVSSNISSPDYSYKYNYNESKAKKTDKKIYKADYVDVEKRNGSIFLDIKLYKNSKEKHRFPLTRDENSDYYHHNIGHPHPASSNYYITLYFFPEEKDKNFADLILYEDNSVVDEIRNGYYFFRDGKNPDHSDNITDKDIKFIKKHLKEHNKILKKLGITPLELMNWAEWYRYSSSQNPVQSNSKLSTEKEEAMRSNNKILETAVAIIAALLLLFVVCKIEKYPFPKLLNIFILIVVVIISAYILYPLIPHWVTILIVFLWFIIKIRERVNNAPVENMYNRFTEMFKIRKILEHLISKDISEIHKMVRIAQVNDTSTLRKNIQMSKSIDLSNNLSKIKNRIKGFIQDNHFITLHNDVTEDLYKLIMKTPQLRAVLEKYNSNSDELIMLFYQLFPYLNTYTYDYNYLAIDAFCYQKPLEYIYKHKDELVTNKDIPENIFNYFNLTKEEESDPDIVFSLFDIKDELEMTSARLAPLNIENDNLVKPTEVSMNKKTFKK